MPFPKGGIPWNKGLTKETDRRVVNYAIKGAETRKGRTPWNKGIKRGRPLSFEVKGKISISLKGREVKEETREKLSQVMKARFANKENHPMYGKRRPEEVCRKISLAQKGKFIPEESRKRMSDTWKRKLTNPQNNPFYGKQHSLETKEKLSQAQKQNWQDPQYASRVSRSLSYVGKLRYENPEERLKDSELVKEAYRRNPKLREKLSKVHRAMWKNPDYIATMMRALHRKPNKSEERLIDIFSKRLQQFEYNGDFRLKVMIGGFIPDFVNVNGKKEVIEFFGDYYHSPDVIGDDWRRSELGKIMVYNSLGWECLVIWGHDLKQLTEEQLLNKIKTFFEGDNGKRGMEQAKRGT